MNNYNNSIRKWSSGAIFRLKSQKLNFSSCSRTLF